MGFEPFADPAQELVGEHADKDAGVDAVFELMETELPLRSGGEGRVECSQFGKDIADEDLDFGAEEDVKGVGH